MHRHAVLAYMMATALAAARTAGVVASGQPGPASPLSIDAFVFDSQGRPVADLRPDQFAVTVDGSPRNVTSARYVHRGPGAEAAARGTLRAGASQGASLFEPSRTILVVVDETSFPRGAEKSIAAAADRLLDRFGPSDHVALVTVPMPADAMAVSFANDRVTVRDTLRGLVGRATPIDALARTDDIRADPPVTDVSAASSAASGATQMNLALRPAEIRRMKSDLEGVRTLRVDFEEPTRPTVISSPTGVDVPASGSFWIDPLTGRIIKTFLRATRVSMSDDRATVTAEITVVFHRSDSLGLWVPAEMREAYRQGSYTIEGRAIYSNFRSFQVRTEQEIKVVKSI